MDHFFFSLVPPSISSNFNATYVKMMGESFKQECEATGEPGLKMSWKKFQEDGSMTNFAPEEVIYLYGCNVIYNFIQHSRCSVFPPIRNVSLIDGSCNKNKHTSFPLSTYLIVRGVVVRMSTSNCKFIHVHGTCKEAVVKRSHFKDSISLGTKDIYNYIESAA